MKKIILSIAIVFIALLLNSCCIKFLYPDDIKKEWVDLKFSNICTNINEILCIHGYYKDTIEDSRVLVFYEDGTFGKFWINEDSINIPNIHLNNNILQDGQKRFPGGCYRCNGDTIECNYYDYVMGFWYMEKFKYIIINSKTIKLVEWQRYSMDPEWACKTNNYLPYHFVPARSLPDSDDADSKRKKWLWKSEDDWRAYKERMKQKKKGRKLKRRNDVITNRP